MTFGLIMIALVAFIVSVINISSNQGIVNRTHSLLNDNFPSVKYSFAMLNILDEINEELLYRRIVQSDSLKNSYAATKDSLLLSNFRQNIRLQQNNITEPGEKELTESLEKAFSKYAKGIKDKEYLYNTILFREKYKGLREYILSIHKLNIFLLERKNEQIKHSTLSILNVQQNVGLIGLSVLGVLIIILPFLLIIPINKLHERMVEFYKNQFNKEIDIKANHELEKLEEIFEKIVLESKAGKLDK
ncbi:MAG: hypothetical protein JXC36_07585 [Candidatus Atribacteria bacterium]|nr:hypothetical protein [Candidatus Atribacteria bacterium]